MHMGMALLILASLLGAVTGCTEEIHEPLLPIVSYRDIPDITDEEIAGIEVLLARGEPLIYASSRSTELFERQDGTLGGYTVLLCDWLSGLFGLSFQPEIQGLGAMLENLRTGGISFATLSATAERREMYSMVDIAQRSIIMLRIKGSQPLSSIRQERLPRYVFTEGSVMTDLAIAALEPGSYESLIVPDENSAYQVLSSGLGDAFIATNTMEAAFDYFSNVYVEDFLPLIFLPAAMSAENRIYKPIISLVTKALESGGREHLIELYRQGYQDYRRQKFSMLLNEEETEFIRNNPVIPFATQYMSYPATFFNTIENRWEGAAFDIMEEIAQLTGFQFRLTHDHTAELTELLDLLESGTAYLMPNLIQTNERRERFIWTDSTYQSDRFALLSKQHFPNIELNDIPNQRVGFPRGSAFADVFRHWFPNALYGREFPNTDDAFEALDRGEIDLVVSSLNRLTALTNYYEFSDFKANYLFNAAFHATFGFNKNHTVLCSIINKALPIIDTDRIMQQWMTRTYNIEAMRLMAQRPWLVSATVLSLFILALVLIMFYRNRKMTAQLEIATGEALEASRAKSDFLAKMSHEIRTPMNAIIGMTELALRTNELDITREHIQTVKQSSANLLSIINDILDFSKIETGKLQIISKEYSLASLLNDVISIIRMRVIDSHIHFVVNVDSTLPNTLTGDEIRIRQVLLNILGNAVKYTEKGFVTFNVSGRKFDDDTFLLTMDVIDSGMGIKKEDMHNLFNEYVQFNTGGRKYVEGTGLGLAISYRIVKAMGGDIDVYSEYGQGSTFSVTIPQKFLFSQPLAYVNNPDTLSVIVYEHRELYDNSIISAVNNLGVRCTAVSGISELMEKINSTENTILFISFALYDNNKEAITNSGSAARVVVLTEFGEVVPDKNLQALVMPVYSISIANVLNGEAVDFSYNESKELIVGFTAPDANVLIVDDIITNLKVAKGLLSPYKMQVDLCKSGIMAIDAIKKNHYDLVFMDHLMPEMDGMETTRRIRAMDPPNAQSTDLAAFALPIIALTANAVSGTREMFLQNGFNDFLSKPIDTIQLNSILEKWLPRDKIIRGL